MPNFTCIRCGWSSLVRSNFRLTPKHEALCRATEACDKRQKRHPNGAPMFSSTGMLLDDQGNRSIFDDVDE